VVAKIDDEVRELALKKGFAIAKPWEVEPWDCDDGPAPGSRDWAVHWERAQKLRRELIAEIEAARCAAKPPSRKRSERPPPR
jgi:hypothetical protein